MFREALDHGLEPVVFEASTDIGGLWRYKPHETEEGTVMKSTVINTSKEMTAYSTFSPPSHFANFMHNRCGWYNTSGKSNIPLIKTCLNICASLQAPSTSTSSFDFNTKFLMFDGQKVMKAVGSGQSNTGNREFFFIIFYDFFSDGSEHCEEFHAVLLCTGHHTRPYWPMPWPGQDCFKGNIIHVCLFIPRKTHIIFFIGPLLQGPYGWPFRWPSGCCGGCWQFWCGHCCRTQPSGKEVNFDNFIEKSNQIKF